MITLPKEDPSWLRYLPTYALHYTHFFPAVQPPYLTPYAGAAPVHRWLPEHHVVIVVDSSFAALDLLAAVPVGISIAVVGEALAATEGLPPLTSPT